MISYFIIQVKITSAHQKYHSSILTLDFSIMVNVMTDKPHSHQTPVIQMAHGAVHMKKFYPRGIKMSGPGQVIYSPWTSI